MFLSVYHFDGEPDVLVEAYGRLVAAFPPDAFDFHLCVRRTDGISVFDGCPSVQVAEAFSTGEGFRGAVAAAGLPEPRTERLGDIQFAVVRGERVLS
jgi:hypothetical protein